MANFKRKKTRRQVRCSMCTAFRWLGNSHRSYTNGGRTAKAARNRVTSEDLQ